MSVFKDIIAQDMNIFMNSNEFAEPHIINGRTFNIVIDNDHLQERSKKEYDGISVGELLYFVAVNEYGNPPAVDEYQAFDNRPMRVFDVREDMGMYEIILKRNE